MTSKLLIVASLLAAQATSAVACDLKVESAWIREAPPNAMALAGYARLSNTGTAPLKIQSIAAAAFGAVETHESFTEGGMARMRPIVVEIPAKGSVELAAGGKHLMLMNPKMPPKKGDVVTLKFTDATGCVTTAAFKVSAPAATAEHDHSKMDHSKMDHSKMDHSSMDHSSMKRE